MDEYISQIVKYCVPDDDANLPTIWRTELGKAMKDEKKMKSLAFMCIEKLLEEMLEPNSTLEIYYKLGTKKPLPIFELYSLPIDEELWTSPETPCYYKDDSFFLKTLVEQNLNNENTSEVCITVASDHTKIVLDELVVLTVPHSEGKEFSDEAAVHYGKMAFKRKIEFVVFEIQTDLPKTDEPSIQNWMKSLNDKFPCETPEEWGDVFMKKTAHVYHKFTKLSDKGVLHNAFIANPNWEIPCEEDYRIFVLD